MAEYRISIYGRKMSEWDQLASWIVNNDLYSENVVWLIQVRHLIDAFVLHVPSICMCFSLLVHNSLLSYTFLVFCLSVH